MIENIDFRLNFEMMSIDSKGEATLVCDREVILDRIVDNLNRFQEAHKALLRDINDCFSISLMDEKKIHFRPERSRAVLHFIVRGLLRINLQCPESRLKYYGDNPFNQTKLGNLIKAASGEFGFDKYPPDIASNGHPHFIKSTAEGRHALQLYGALEALRRSVYKRDWDQKRKITSSSSNQQLLTLDETTRTSSTATINTSPLELPTTTDKVTSSPSSNSNQLTSVLGKRTSSSMESSPLGTTNSSPLDEVTSSSSSRINQPSSIMGKLSSSVASVFNSLSVIIGGRTAEENEDEKEKTGMNLREELDNTENADDESVECPRGSTKIGEDVCFLT